MSEQEETWRGRILAALPFVVSIYNVQFAIVHLQIFVSVAFIAASYLCGSIPFGVLIARANGVDIRQVGSGNIGATNVARACGLRWGLLVFGLDFLKAFSPALAAKLLAHRWGDDAFMLYDLPVLCGLAAVLGGVYSVWLGFRGGKAGATGLGVGAVICWQAMLVAVFVWLVVVWLSRYVSLGTVLGSLTYVASYFAEVIMLERVSPLDRQHITTSIFCGAVAALVIVRHKDNIVRLINGTENRVNFAGPRAGDKAVQRK